LALKIIHAIVLFLPKTVLLEHLNNSLCNVTVESLINNQYLVSLLIVFRACSIKEYFTLEKMPFLLL
jgi:hypothetical protein